MKADNMDLTIEGHLINSEGGEYITTAEAEAFINHPMFASMKQRVTQSVYELAPPSKSTNEQFSALAGLGHVIFAIEQLAKYGSLHFKDDAGIIVEVGSGQPKPVDPQYTLYLDLPNQFHAPPPENKFLGEAKYLRRSVILEAVNRFIETFKTPTLEAPEDANAQGYMDDPRNAPGRRHNRQIE